MKRLVILVLLVLSSFNISNSSQIIKQYKSKEFYYREYKLFQEIANIYKEVSDKLGNTKKFKNLPLSLPIVPNHNYNITSKYGIRHIHPILKTYSFHKGIDIGTMKGTKVYATAKGTIKRSTHDFMGYGKFIEIEHENNVSTIYAHLSKRLVNVGDVVNIGDVIGNVGNSGLSTGNHLHYEIRKNNIPIDPETIIPFSINSSNLNILTINKFIKNVQMETKEITEKYTLSELKNLKDVLVNRITAREHNLKYGKVKKLSTVENSIANIKLDVENLIRVKSVLAKANAVEYEIKENKITSNNQNIFKLSLLRDLKKSLSILSSTEEFSNYCKDEIEKINTEITEIDKTLKEFNCNTNVEIKILKEV